MTSNGSNTIYRFKYPLWINFRHTTWSQHHLQVQVPLTPKIPHYNAETCLTTWLLWQTVPTSSSSRFQHRLRHGSNTVSRSKHPRQVPATPQGPIWDNLYRRLPKGATNKVVTSKDKSQLQKRTTTKLTLPAK